MGDIADLFGGSGIPVDEVTKDLPERSFDPIPAGWYKAICTNAEMKETRAGTGTYLNCTFTIVEGQYENRLVFHMYTLSNPNGQAVQIGASQLAAFGKAVGLEIVLESSDLLNKPLMIRVGIQKGKNGYEDKNRVNEHFSLSEYAEATSNPTSNVSAKKQSGGALPWQQKKS